MSDEICVKVKSNGGNRCLSMYYVDPVSNRRVVKSTGTHNGREAERMAGEWERELQRGGGQSPSKITWQKFRERFEAERFPMITRSSQKNFSAAFNHLERLMAPDKLAKLTTAVMSAFQTRLRKEGMRETTLAGTLMHLKAALRWAERQGMMVKAPRFDMPKAAKGSRGKGRPITTEEFERMLAAVDKVRPADAEKWRRLLTGLWHSGLRLGEALSLSWDYEAPFRIDLSGKRPVFIIRAAGQKSRRDETAPLTPEFAEWLQATFPEAEWEGKVFGINLTMERVSEAICKIGKLAGAVTNKAEGKFASAHDFRRAFGTRWAKRITTPVLQRLMRHANIQTTMSFYVNLDAEEIADNLWADFGQEKPQNGNTCGNTPTEKPLISRK
ncbi:MAG: site-specific integrase [Pirellulales bacterium]|nr:site-specific integrase [Pirellulales bacterium]